MKDVVFSDLEFDLLHELFLPFDHTFPRLQPYFDRLVFHLTLTRPHEISDFDEYRRLAIKARMNRPEHKFNRDYLQSIFVGLAKVLNLACKEFPQYSIHCDRLMFEIGEELVPGYHKQTFTEFHVEGLLRRRQAADSKIGGLG